MRTRFANRLVRCEWLMENKVFEGLSLTIDVGVLSDEPVTAEALPYDADGTL